MGPGQHASLNLDGAYAAHIPAVNSRALVDNAAAHHLLFKIRQNVRHGLEGGLVTGPGRITGKGCHDIILDLLAGLLARQFFGDAQGLVETGSQGQFLNTGQQIRIVRVGSKLHLGLAAKLPQLHLRVYERLYFLSAPFQGFDDHILRHKGGFAFDHGQGIAAGRENQIDVAVRKIGKTGIEHKLAIDAAYPAASHRAGKGQRGDHQGR